MEGTARLAPEAESDSARTATLSDAMIDAIVARGDGIRAPLYLEELDQKHPGAWRGA